MAPKVKAAFGVLSDAIETACGWAFGAVAIYALLFVNMTGNGTLWDSMRGVIMDQSVAPPKAAAVQTRVVPVRPVDSMAVAQNRMLMVPSEPTSEFSVPVLAADQPRAADQITDAPADAKAGKSWKKHLNGSLRTFTVYGEGEQRSSASTSVGAAAAAPSREFPGGAPQPGSDSALVLAASRKLGTLAAVVIAHHLGMTPLSVGVCLGKLRRAGLVAA